MPLHSDARRATAKGNMSITAIVMHSQWIYFLFHCFIAEIILTDRRQILPEETPLSDRVGCAVEAERLQRITEKLLTLTRLDAGTPVEAEAVPVEEVAQRVTHMLRPLARAVEVDLRVKLEEGLTVRATRDDLYQILFNLMENAVKYNLPGGEITLAGKGEEAWAVLTVEDTGVGIPAEDVDKVFDRFYRVDKARSRAAGGTGLGLSIVRDTAKRHGGEVTAQRREPEGTRFTLTFPLCERGEEA